MKFIPAPEAYGINRSIIVRTQHWNPLIRWTRQFGWTHGAEIGVARGHVIFNLLRACPKLSMIGVDQWRHMPARAELGAEVYHDQATLDRFAADVKAQAASFGSRCVILHMDHAKAAELVEDESLDFVFLDASHTERDTINAIDVWQPKLRAFGFLTGHDYSWPSVRAALDSRLPGWTANLENVWSYPI